MARTAAGAPDTPTLLPTAFAWWLAAGTAIAVGVVFLALLGTGLCHWPSLCGRIEAVDVAQARLDTALPAPQGTLVVEQSFIPQHNGLTAVELLLLRHDGQPAADAFFEVALLDDLGAVVFAERTPVARLSHNQSYTLAFPPQRDSAGRRYTIRLSGSADNVVSAWAYSLDVLTRGALALVGGALEQPPTTAARELRFSTRYALTGGEALAAAVRPLRDEGRLLLAAALLVPLPGVWLLLAFRPRRRGDVAAGLGAALALGVAAWPVIWLWLTLAGGRWSRPSLWAVVALGWAGAAALTLWRWRSGRPLTADRRPLPSAPLPTAPLPTALLPTDLLTTDLLTTDLLTTDLLTHSLLLLLLLAALALRFIAVRDLAFPPWVDASRHALITAVMVSTGRAPDGYAPYLPVETFPYHFGFHTLSAGLALLTGWPLPGLLLTLGQLLNGLLPLSVYAAGRLATGRRAVGLLAAFLVALPFFFPGYYVTWGRLTQLAAMVIMPVLLALTWRLGRGGGRYWPLVGVLAAGLFLVHFRVFLFYVPFAVLALVVQAAGRRARPLLGAGALALLLVLPRLVRLLAETDPLATLGQSQPGYNDFPSGYVTTGWERLYLALAAVATLAVFVAVLRRRRWAAFPALLLVWVAALFLLLAGDRLGLPETLVVNLNSMYITLFLPLSLLLSIVTVAVGDRVGTWLGAGIAPGESRQFAARFVLAHLLPLLAGVALGVLAVFGARQQANIVNPETILALPADQTALDWMAANLPADARVAVNAWQWLGATWAGSDGGAWIVPLTGRQTTTPPVDHIYDAGLFAEVRAFNEAAAAIADWSDPAAAGWLRGQGVSHVYAGQRGGPFDPAELSRNPSLTLLYQNEGAFVFAVNP